MRLFKLPFLSLFKLPFSISGENRSLHEHLRAKFGLRRAVKTPKPKTGQFFGPLDPYGEVNSDSFLKFGGKKVYSDTKGVLSSENSNASTGTKEVWCIPKSFFSREKEGKYIYTKEPSRWLLGTPSRSIGV